MLLLSLLFCVFAGFFMAVMDRTNESVAFRQSVFGKLNQKWWLRSVSWQYVKFIPGTKYRPDAWHIAKTLMIMSVAFSGTALMHEPVFLLQQPLLNFLSVSAGWSILLTASFVVFYDYILKYKVKKDGTAGGSVKAAGIDAEAAGGRTDEGRRDLPSADG